MKKTIILVIIVLCLLSLSACSKKKELDVFTMMQKSSDCFFRKKGDNKTYYWMGKKWLIVEDSLVHESDDSYMSAEWEYEFDYYLGGNKMIIVFVYPSDYIRINGKLYALNSDVDADGIYKKAETFYSIIQNHPDEYECPTYSYPNNSNGVEE